MAIPYRVRAARSTPASLAGDTLGPLLRRYRIGANRHVIWGAAPFVLLLAYGVHLGQEGQLAHWFNSTFSVGAVTILFVLSISLIAYTAAVGGAEVVRVYSHGLFDLRSGQALRWDEVHSLTAVWSDQDQCVDRYLLQTSSGATMVFGRAIGGIEQLVDEVRVRVADRVPALQARLLEGGFARFGRIAVRAQGLMLGERQLGWDEVGRLDAEGGEIVVRTRAGERWGAVPMQEVPNAFLLAELASELSRRPIASRNER